jgi:hypothetical protein
MTTTDPAPRLALLAETADERSFNDPVFRVTIRPVLVDTSGSGPWQVTAPRSYGDYRELEDFAVEAYRDNIGSQLLMPGARFADVYRVRLADAKSMLHVLTKVDRTVTRLTRRFGAPRGPAAYAAYVAEALGIRGERVFLRKVDAEHDYAGIGYQEMDADALARHLREAEAAWAKRHGLPEHDET